MNIRWLKQNLTLVVVAVGFLVALGAILWSVQQASAHKNQIVTELEEQQGQLQRLREGRILPSTNNIEIVRHDREQVVQLYNMLRQTVAQEPLKVPDFQRNIDFVQHMRVAQGELADEARRNQVKTPEAFAFGFSRYNDVFPCSKPAAKDEDCRKVLGQLAEQLTVVQKLGKLVLSSGIQELTQIRRVEVESGPSSADALSLAVNQGPNALYKMLPLEIQFICDTKALQTLLNTLSKSDWFFAVRTLRIEPGSAPTTSGTSAPVAEPGRPGTTEPPRIIERTHLAVTMRIDLIEMTTETAKEKPQT
jgi:hypothetical protein